ncbi:transferase, partial [Streptomyces sp. NPDC047072]
MSDSSLPALPALPASDRPEVTARLREALLGASFTADGLLDLLGAPAYAALARSETVPALRATRGDTPLETLVRLFLLQQPVRH